jgi:hypothetical protein
MAPLFCVCVPISSYEDLFTIVTHSEAVLQL